MYLHIHDNIQGWELGCCFGGECWSQELVCCWSVVDDVLSKGGYGGLDIIIQDVQLGKLLECRILDIGYCNMNVFNLGNWGVVICRVQQGSLETTAFSMFSKVGVSRKAWDRSDMEAIVCLGRHNKLSRYQKCGLNICYCARKLTMNRGNGGVFISQLGSQAHVLTAASHGLGCGGWSCHECQSGPCAARVFQYRDILKLRSKKKERKLQL